MVVGFALRGCPAEQVCGIGRRGNHRKLARQRKPTISHGGELLAEADATEPGQKRHLKAHALGIIGATADQVPVAPFCSAHWRWENWRQRGCRAGEL